MKFGNNRASSLELEQLCMEKGGETCGTVFVAVTRQVVRNVCFKSVAMCQRPNSI
jgi:hypothetical protein